MTYISTLLCDIWQTTAVAMQCWLLFAPFQQLHSITTSPTPVQQPQCARFFCHCIDLHNSQVM